MKRLLFIALFTLSFGSNGVAQTYTYNRTNAGCDGNWNTASCWTKTNLNTPTGCTNSTQNTPPLNSTTTSCEINVIINGDVTFTGNMTLGGNFKNLTVNSNSTLTATGNITIAAGRVINFITNGGIIDVQGTGGIILQSGTTTNSPKAEFPTTLNISGNGFGAVLVKNIDFNNLGTINVNSGGTLINSGLTKYVGQDNIINVNSGFFRTSDLEVVGKNNQFNISNGGIGVIDNNMKFAGGSEFEVTGGSEMEIGGVVQIQNNVDVKISIDSIVKFCGTSQNSPSQKEIEDMEKAGIIVRDANCRILPVEILYFETNYNSNLKSAALSWATAKEYANSHFEIERSDKGINDFRKIGEVDGMGWKDTVTEYEFIDEKLPLSGGNLYYRIKQVDFDGKYTYSKVLAIRAEGVQATTGAWRAFPNPTLGDELRISLLDRTQYDEEP
ncbi:hypothetical protein, partial [Belliella pelovolcani]|uniref:hypothetical protein n=1 Tax=Belliella pelovolcani TaxID=529505 RepID=UPI00391C2DFA